jgi:hypothetical protein
MTLAVGMIFVGYLALIWGGKSFEDIAAHGGVYLGMLSLVAFCPTVVNNFLGHFGLVGSFVALALNPFVLVSIVAAVGLWMRRGWGRRTAIALAVIGLFASVNSAFWNIVRCMYFPRSFEWAAQVGIEITFAVFSLVPLLW